jgi:hypothetical protein
MGGEVLFSADDAGPDRFASLVRLPLQGVESALDLGTIAISS